MVVTLLLASDLDYIIEGERNLA